MKNCLYTLYFTFLFNVQNINQKQIVLSSIIVKCKKEKISVKHETEEDLKSYI